MLKKILIIPFFLFSVFSFSQVSSIDKFLADSSMTHASVSLYIIDASSGEIVADHNSGKSLTQASIMKLITTAAAIELLGPDHTFKTTVGYTGTIKKGSKTLDGDIIIKGGGDPALGSENFKEHYDSFIERWIKNITELGIKKIKGRIVTDDTYFDYQPVPSKWTWEDLGNYYGAGVYGLSVFDNTCQIHFKTLSKGSKPEITNIFPDNYETEPVNFLTASGSKDEGYVFSVPYSQTGWIAGSIPENKDDFILKASITDPSLLIAKIVDQRLKEAGITIINNPSTTRLLQHSASDKITVVAETVSPPLSDIIEVLNHESVNLYAEHLTKELGKVFKNQGSTVAGTEVVMSFLDSAGIKTDGMFIEDGSGLSPVDAVNSKEMVNLLLYMKKNGKHFEEFLRSLPDAGKEGTLKNYFKDPLFDSRMKAKSGTLSRVKSYTGYFTTLSDKEMIFSIIVNNFTGPSAKIISGIEEIIKETILYK